MIMDEMAVVAIICLTLIVSWGTPLKNDACYDQAEPEPVLVTRLSFVLVGRLLC